MTQISRWFCLATTWCLVACGSKAHSDGAQGATSAGSAANPDSNGATSGGTSFVGPSLNLPGSDPGGAGSSSGNPDQLACDAQCTSIGSCVNHVCTVSENPGGVAQSTQTTLMAGGNSDAAFQYLYPYDRTVFARGLLAPTLQFAGDAADALMVHLSTAAFDYRGFFGASSPVRVTLPQPVWEVLGRSLKPGESVNVETTKISAGAVAGPIAERWLIAPGVLRGTIYYETVVSKMLNGDVGVMRIRPGERMPTPLVTGCANVCHSASADGSTLVAAGDGVSSQGTHLAHLDTSTSYDLKNNASIVSSNQDTHFVYGGLYPDGTFLMSATNYRTWGGQPSRLYDTKTRAPISAPGWDGIVKNAGVPAFSPDGKKLAFNHEDGGFGHSVAAMDFSDATKTFSNLVDLATDPVRYIGWPGFTPDNRRVIYHAGSSPAFETGAGTTLTASGALFTVDVATKTVQALDAANGPKADSTFVPTILPVAVGGYFWVMYTSHRNYGNTLAGDKANGKLWVSALDIDSPPNADPSHPGFFLEGQELEAVNLRGFWALDPCRATGAGCEGGDQCCDGFCRDAGGAKMCVPPQTGGCSNESESCTTAVDCCDKTQLCINGHCSLPTIR